MLATISFNCFLHFLSNSNEFYCQNYFYKSFITEVKLKIVDGTNIHINVTKKQCSRDLASQLLMSYLEI